MADLCVRHARESIKNIIFQESGQLCLVTRPGECRLDCHMQGLIEEVLGAITQLRRPSYFCVTVCGHAGRYPSLSGSSAIRRLWWAVLVAFVEGCKGASVLQGARFLQHGCQLVQRYRVLVYSTCLQ